MVHFDISEFDCECGCKTGEMNKYFLKILDAARHIAETPFVITSGLRCANHNKRSNGKKNSSHVSGYAADIKASDSRSRFLILNALLSVGFNRIGISEGFIHCDVDPSKPPSVIWTYN